MPTLSSIQVPQFNAKVGGSRTFFSLLFLMLGSCLALMFYLFYFSTQSTTISAKDKIISWGILLSLCLAAALFYFYFSKVLLFS